MSVEPNYLFDDVRPQPKRRKEKKRAPFTPPVEKPVILDLALRPYQFDMIDRVRESMGKGNRRVLLQVPTGGGKTVISVGVVQAAYGKGNNVLFLADRRKLIDQAADQLRSYGLDAGVIMAGREPKDSGVQVASIQTLWKRGVERDLIELPNVELVIIDEAHKSLGAMYDHLVRQVYPQAFILGLTATPVRSDGRGLGEMYDDLVLGPSVTDLTDAGYLVPVRYYSPSLPDLSKVKINRDTGDYQERALGKFMESQTPLIGDIVDNFKRICPDRKAVVFASSVKHSRYIAQAFNEGGIRAEHIDGTTYQFERDRIYDDLRVGRTQVLVNCMVLTEGWDEPSISACILARPTKSLGTYLQMAGRILRPFEGKDDAIIIDHTGSVRELGFVDDEHPWSLDSSETIQDRLENLDKEEKEERKPTVCDDCGTTYKGQRKCPMCGWEPPKPSEPVEMMDALLVEIQKREREAEYRKTFYQECLGLEGVRRRNGWAKEAYRMKFKEDPPAGLTPLAPSDETYRWEKYMRIRAFYSKNKRGR